MKNYSHAKRYSSGVIQHQRIDLSAASEAIIHFPLIYHKLSLLIASFVQNFLTVRMKNDESKSFNVHEDAQRRCLIKISEKCDWTCYFSFPRILLLSNEYFHTSTHPSEHVEMRCVRKSINGSLLVYNSSVLCFIFKRINFEVLLCPVKTKQDSSLFCFIKTEVERFDTFELEPFLTSNSSSTMSFVYMRRKKASAILTLIIQCSVFRGNPNKRKEDGASSSIVNNLLIYSIQLKPNSQMCEL